MCSSYAPPPARAMALRCASTKATTRARCSTGFTKRAACTRAASLRAWSSTPALTPTPASRCTMPPRAPGSRLLSCTSATCTRASRFATIPIWQRRPRPCYAALACRATVWPSTAWRKCSRLPPERPAPTPSVTGRPAMAPLPLQVPVQEVEITAVRAQGPGGQNVNKVSSAIHLRFDVAASSLPEDVKQRLLALRDTRITQEGVVVIKARQYRSQEQNCAAALERLNTLVNSVALPPRACRATKPSYRPRQRRLQDKTQRSATKALRGPVRDGLPGAPFGCQVVRESGAQTVRMHGRRRRQSARIMQEGIQE